MSNERQRIAVIGASVSGLTAAWLLAEKHDVEIFEATSQLVFAKPGNKRQNILSV